MSAVPHPPWSPSVTVHGNEVVLNGFREGDADVVALVGEAEDPEGAIHRVLRTGAQAIRVARVSIETDVVDQRVAAMTDTMREAVDEAAAKVTAATAQLFDQDEGEVPAALAAFKQSFDRALGNAFDPTRKQSVVSLIEDMVGATVQKLADEQLRAFRRTLDPDSGDSPLARVVQAVKDQTSEVNQQLRQLVQTLEVDKARSEGLARSAVKGLAYEDLVVRTVAPIAAMGGDLAEGVGRETGSSGTKAGDVVVTISPEDVNGANVCYTLEAKDRKLGRKAILHELDLAIANRGALAAVAVFARADQAPGYVPFQTHGDKAIAVFDKDELDDRALRLACMWARWVTRRKAATPSATLDVTRIEGHLDKARRAMQASASVKRAHSTARNAIAAATEQFDGLVDEIDTALDALSRELHAP